MFKLRKDLKYIKIIGEVTDQGVLVGSDSAANLYSNLIITDKDGCEIIFNNAVIPLKLNERISDFISSGVDLINNSMKTLEDKQAAGVNVDKEIDELERAQLMTFYALRCFKKDKIFGDKYSGVIYAVESNGEKIYFKDEAEVQLKVSLKLVILELE